MRITKQDAVDAVAAVAGVVGPLLPGPARLVCMAVRAVLRTVTLDDAGDAERARQVRHVDEIERQHAAGTEAARANLRAWAKGEKTPHPEEIDQ
jgi:hypothetical protein